MSIAYFPCLCIVKENRVVLSVSTIASLTSMFENWVFQYMSDPKQATEDVNKQTEAAQMKKVMELQIYSLYVYQADPDTRLFLLTSITVGNNALKELFNALYTSYQHHLINPLNQSDHLNTSKNSALYRDIYNVLSSYEKEMDF
ncbi:hypothetical protein WA556_006788 [Blastocystis sp. ATCC 50177/Nand II]